MDIDKIVKGSNGRKVLWKRHIKAVVPQGLLPRKVSRVIKRAIKVGIMAAITFGTFIGCTGARQESNSRGDATKPIIQPLDLQQRASDISDLHFYRDDKFPFSLMYPKDWENVAVNHFDTRVSLINRKPDGSLNAGFNITVEHSPVLKELPPAELVDHINRYQNSSVDALKKAFNEEIKVVQRGEVKLSGQVGYYLLIEGDRKDDEVKSIRLLQMVTFHDGNTYSLSFSSETDNYNSLLPVFKLVASTFRIMPSS